MIKNILTHIVSIDRYGIASMCLFVSVFVSTFIWAFSLKKAHLKHMAGMPLEDDEVQTPTPEHGHE
jgi:hypothetical protein